MEEKCRQGRNREGGVVFWVVWFEYLAFFRIPEALWGGGKGGILLLGGGILLSNVVFAAFLFVCHGFYLVKRKNENGEPSYFL